MTSEPKRPPASCPAQHGIDINAADFTFVALHHPGAKGRPARTEAFACFKASGQDHDALLHTASFEVPPSSAVAQAARHAAAHLDIQARIAAILRRNVNCCPCQPDNGTCPALDSEHLLLALCRVTRPQPGTESNTVPGRPTEHPITAECLLDCLAPHLSAHALNPLRRELPALFQRPATIGDVVYLHQRHTLDYIRHLGPRRIGEIELVLILAGLLAPPSRSPIPSSQLPE